MKKLINIAVLVAIAIVAALSVSPAEAAAPKAKVCATKVTVVGKVQKFGIITGVPATITTDKCDVLKIVVHNSGMGNTGVAKTALARVDAWPSIFNMFTGSLTLTGGGTHAFSAR